METLHDTTAYSFSEIAWNDLKETPELQVEMLAEFYLTMTDEQKDRFEILIRG